MWKSFGEEFRERGRTAWPFVAVVVLCFIVGPFWEEGGRFAFAGLMGILLYLTVRAMIRLSRGHDRLGKLPPLSRHDLKVARSKLTKNRNRR